MTTQPQATATSTHTRVRVLMLRMLLGVIFVTAISLLVIFPSSQENTVKAGVALKTTGTQRREMPSFSLATSDKFQQKNVQKDFLASGAVAIQLPRIKALAVSGGVALHGRESYARIFFGDALVANIEYPDSGEVRFSQFCTETCALNATTASLTVEVNDATLHVDSFEYLPENGTLKPEAQNGISAYQLSMRKAQNKETIDALNRENTKRGEYWLAGDTGEVITKKFAEQKKVVKAASLPLPARLHNLLFYKGGYYPISQSASAPEQKQQSGGQHAITSVPFTFDWRSRQGQNWMTSVKNQLSCGACWAFGTIGSFEATINVFYNQHLDKNLSEQTLVSCDPNNYGCSGGGGAFAFLQSTGAPDETCFPYVAQNGTCTNRCADWQQRSWKSTSMGTSSDESSGYTNSLEVKTALQKNGPMLIGTDSHIVTLTGYGEVTAGCYFNSWTTGCTLHIPEGDPLIGTTYWLVKNSWGTGWGEGGYGKYIDPIFTNTNTGYFAITPIPPTAEPAHSIACQDNDSDGFCWWGVSPTKPATGCPTSCQAQTASDCDDTDPALGVCTSQHLCGNRPLTATKEFTPFGSYYKEGLTYGLTGCCGEGVGEYPVGGNCCSAATDTIANTTSYQFASSQGGAGSGDGEFNYPRSMVESNSLVYVADSNNNRIEVFGMTPEGPLTFQTTIGSLGSGPGQFNHPQDVFVDGQLLFVADSENNRVQVFDIQSPTQFVYLTSFGSQGTGNGQFNHAWSVSKKGNLIAAGDFSRRIQFFQWDADAHTATYLQTLGGYGSGDGQFGGGIGSITFSGNTLFACDGGNYPGRIQAFTKQPDGSYAYSWKFQANCEYIQARQNSLFVTWRSEYLPRVSSYRIHNTQALFEQTFPSTLDLHMHSFTGVAVTIEDIFVGDTFTNQIHRFLPETVAVCSATCQDGTPYSQCSNTRPSLCENGALVNACDICGCPTNYICQSDGQCQPHAGGGSPAMLKTLPATQYGGDGL